MFKTQIKFYFFSIGDTKMLYLMNKFEFGLGRLGRVYKQLVYVRNKLH